MSEIHGQSGFDELARIYGQLSEQDVEEFYSGYQLWYLRQQFAAFHSQADTLRRQIAENTERWQQVQPSAVALASLARFQTNGVTDVDLLDRMLERGEVWLDQTVQRLDYCERFDFIQGDYTHWCENALEGAFDWIDSIGETNSVEIAVEPEIADEELTEATEELLLQKLSSEEEEEGSLLGDTLKRAAVTSDAAVEDAGQPQAEQQQVEGEVPQTSSPQEIALTTDEGVLGAESVSEVEIGQAEENAVGDSDRTEVDSEQGQDIVQVQIAPVDDGAGESGPVSAESLVKQASVRASVVTARRKRPGFLLRLVGALVKLFFG